MGEKGNVAEVATTVVGHGDGLGETIISVVSSGAQEVGSDVGGMVKGVGLGMAEENLRGRIKGRRPDGQAEPSGAAPETTPTRPVPGTGTEPPSA